MDNFIEELKKINLVELSTNDNSIIQKLKYNKIQGSFMDKISLK